MASTKSKKSRKGLAIGLAILGIAGLSLATASQLSLTPSGKFQTGAVTLDADCQGTTAIGVTFPNPVLNTATGLYNAPAVVFTGVKSTTAECGGQTVRVAYKTTGVYTAITPNPANVPTTITAGSTSSLTVTLPAGVTQNDITGISLTI